MKMIKYYMVTIGSVLLILAGLSGLHVSAAGGQEPYGTPPDYTPPAAPSQGPYGTPPDYTPPAAPAQEPYGTPPPAYSPPAAAPPQGAYGTPPAYIIATAPSVVELPGTYVYAVPGINVPILFYHGFWWRPFEGRWYRATFYNGPWVYVGRRRVPEALIALPPDFYLRIPVGLPLIPFIELRDNWARWERERHWDRPREWHEEHRERRFDDRW